MNASGARMGLFNTKKYSVFYLSAVTIKGEDVLQAKLLDGYFWNREN